MYNETHLSVILRIAGYTTTIVATVIFLYLYFVGHSVGAGIALLFTNLGITLLIVDVHLFAKELGAIVTSKKSTTALILGFVLILFGLLLFIWLSFTKPEKAIDGSMLMSAGAAILISYEHVTSKKVGTRIKELGEIRTRILALKWRQQRKRNKM